MVTIQDIDGRDRSIESPIKIKPQAWGPPGIVKFDYISPDGSLWNVDSVIGHFVQLWQTDVWGAIHTMSVTEREFREEWKPNESRSHEPESPNAQPEPTRRSTFFGFLI